MSLSEMPLAKYHIYFKVAGITIIALLLMIPTQMIKELINERESTQRQAINEVSGKWGKEQTLTGPFITIPYNKPSKNTFAYIHILPEVLNIKGNISPERRYRGIYEIVVYNSKISFEGSFESLDLSQLDVPLEDIRFDKAKVVVGVDDLKGIEKQIQLSWNNETFSFDPGVPSNEVIASGINSNVSIKESDSLEYKFKFSLDLKGSQLLYFTPVGKVTDVKIESVWENPSFNGMFLPDSREISSEGFLANWNVLHLNRNYPQQWKGGNRQVRQSSFGIDLILPVGNYQKSYRSIRYAILFIGLTFLVFFFIEMLQKVYIHPIQYILVGIALVVFYTLLLSISEHVTFNIAFLISALSTLLLIGGYVKSILKSTPLSLLISGVLLVLYSFIFVIIQLQDFSLLIGSIGVFIILALTIYFSRKIDWYSIQLHNKNEEDDSSEISM